MITVYKADSIIQREALLNALYNAGIRAQSPPRDISRKVTSTTVDLSFEGYSSFFDGFAIQVQDHEEHQAKEVIQKFLRETNVSLASEKPPVRYLQSFYFCSLFSLMIPILLQALALIYLYKGLRNNEKLEIGKTFFAGLCHLVGFGWISYLLRDYF